MMRLYLQDGTVGGQKAYCGSGLGSIDSYDGDGNLQGTGILGQDHRNSSLAGLAYR